MRSPQRVRFVTDSLDRLFEGRREMLSAPEVAELLGMTKQGVYNWLREGVIPGYKLGTSWFISRDELKEALRRGANAPRERSQRPESDHEGD